MKDTMKSPMLLRPTRASHPNLAPVLPELCSELSGRTRVLPPLVLPDLGPEVGFGYGIRPGARSGRFVDDDAQRVGWGVGLLQRVGGWFVS
ncbi:hypothetical protein [Nocardia fusca]|uniref:Uncharacterized protein n=1 Tax=Nocardia fusca TaxID=941183 RepID=A0ABV3FGB1_9NOCA